MITRHRKKWVIEMSEMFALTFLKAERFLRRSWIITGKKITSGSEKPARLVSD
jgi:hypothetical protein